ncbi:MAG: hypothetical protein M0Q54_11270 [Pigmentiphaga sp.]|nr:hypothetical protein [Pigmentiphaga sp.]
MPVEKIPIVVVSGALGSGKSALIQALLAIKPWSASALIINEAGEVNIDHQLLGQVAYASENVTAGCVCCDGAASLIDRLQDLFWLHLTKKIPALRQVLIEASGVADPAQLHQTLTSDAFIRSRFAPPVMLKTVDALQLAGPVPPTGGLYQILTKTDLLSAEDRHALSQRLLHTTPPLAFLKPDFLRDLEQWGERWPEALPPLAPPPVNAAEADASHWPCLTIALQPQEARRLRDGDLEAVYARQGAALARLKAVLEDTAGHQRVIDIVHGRLYPSRGVTPSGAGPSANHVVVFGQRAALLAFQIDLRKRLSE